MRRRLVISTVVIIVAVLAALVPPVVVLLHRAAERELEVRLSSQASSISTAIADQLLQTGQVPPVDTIARFVPDGDLLVITRDGIERLRFPADGAEGSIRGSASGPAGFTITMSTSGASLSRRVRTPLFLLAGFAAAAIALGAALAAFFGARLTRPLEHLAAAADRLGAGDFSTAVPPPSGIREIDGIGAALGTSAQRLDQMLTAERSFTGDATHQLRTGLTGIGLQLELLVDHSDPEVRADAQQALGQVERLSSNLDELLALSRGGAGGQRVQLDLAVLIGHHVDDWRPRLQHAGRVVDLHRRTTLVRATPGFVGQIVDILLDNAVRHGQGVIEVDVGERRVVVRDSGSVDRDQVTTAFLSDAPPTEAHGRGLALAQRLARADGGSLELMTAWTTTFELRYPESTPTPSSQDGDEQV